MAEAAPFEVVVLPSDPVASRRRVTRAMANVELDHVTRIFLGVGPQGIELRGTVQFRSIEHRYPVSWWELPPGGHPLETRR